MFLKSPFQVNDCGYMNQLIELHSLLITCKITVNIFLIYFLNLHFKWTTFYLISKVVFREPNFDIFSQRTSQPVNQNWFAVNDFVYAYVYLLAVLELWKNSKSKNVGHRKLLSGAQSFQVLRPSGTQRKKLISNPVS